MQYTTTERLATLDPVLFYQDFKDTFVCNTQLCSDPLALPIRCFIRISKILLYAIHNNVFVGLDFSQLFYQDFKDTFGCNTQPDIRGTHSSACCFIWISKILLDAIHNLIVSLFPCCEVVLSGFQRTILLQKYRKNRKYANL